MSKASAEVALAVPRCIACPTPPGVATTLSISKLVSAPMYTSFRRRPLTISEKPRKHTSALLDHVARQQREVSAHDMHVPRGAVLVGALGYDAQHAGLVAGVVDEAVPLVANRDGNTMRTFMSSDQNNSMSSSSNFSLDVDAAPAVDAGLRLRLRRTTSWKLHVSHAYLVSRASKMAPKLFLCLFWTLNVP